MKAAPARWLDCYPGLQHWQGIHDLKAAVRRIAAAPATHGVALASRSSVLMRAAAKLMFRVCNKVLVTDCGWPTYQAEVEDAAARLNRSTICVEIRKLIFHDRPTLEAVVESIANRYDQDQCDGLFLPAVDNLGVMLPIAEIIRAVESIRKPRFVVIDGAQALGHLPRCNYHGVCDVFIAGCHKWLRSYLPLGIAVFGSPRSREWINHYLTSPAFLRSIDDPLLRFSQAIETGQENAYSETVNVAPLFNCRAALADADRTLAVRRENWASQQDNARQVRVVAESMGWRMPEFDPRMRTGIVVIDAPRSFGSGNRWSNLREAFGQNGIVASTYENRRVRMSMPQEPLCGAELTRISTTLNHLSGRCSLAGVTAISA